MIAKTTSFNNQKLLFGNFTNKKIQIGAYLSETVDVSIASSHSSVLGHVSTSTLSLKAQKQGTVKLGIYSSIRNRAYPLEPVDIAYNNKPENGVGALADAINKMRSDINISAYFTVLSQTRLSIAAGWTDADFAINGIRIGEIEVKGNDSDGALTKAINRKTSYHGIIADVDSEGILTLTSLDGRAIKVT